MAKSKLLIGVFVALLAFVYYLPTIGAHTMIVGYRQPQDYLVQTLRVISPPQSNSVASQQRQFYNLGNVTMVAAYDQFTNGTGGHAWIVNGGLNQSYVTVGMKSSAVRRGFDYVISIYGKQRR